MLWAASLETKDLKAIKCLCSPVNSPQSSKVAVDSFENLYYKLTEAGIELAANVIALEVRSPVRGPCSEHRSCSHYCNMTVHTVIRAQLDELIRLEERKNQMLCIGTY